MRILGIDPGSQATGFGVIEGAAGALVHVSHGTLRAPRSAEISSRLATIYRGLREVIENHRPDTVVVERTFVAASPRSALVLGEARGAALAAAGEHGLVVTSYAAREIKQAVTGFGGAAKRDVQDMVRRLLTLERLPASDAADALAAAICHAHRGGLPEGVGRRPVRRRGRRGGRFVVRG
jgi:crossover junction endodeoxyribonuclease RuvC